MKIKPGDKLPHNDFYLDESNEVKKFQQTIYLRPER